MPKPWYQIKPRAAVTTDASTQTSAEVLIYGDIGESWYEETVAAKDFVKAIAELDVDELIVRINSIGGSVPDGLAIHNALKRHRATITTCNDGIAMSIASLVFMAGDKRQMAENALFMMHAPWWYVGGNSAELREYADQLDKWAEAMASSYATASGKPKDEVLAILTDGKDHYFTAEEALAEGYVTEVTTSTPAAAAAALRMVAQSRYHPSASGEKRADVSTLPGATGKQSPAAAAAQSTQEQHMPHPNNPAAPDAAAEAARKEALAADKSRREGIRAAAKPFASRPGVAELVQTLEDDHTVTAEAAGLKILAHLAQGVTPIAGSHVETVEDETDKRHAGIIQALMVRAGIADADTRKAVASGNPWRSDTLLDIAKASLDHAGIKYRGKDKMEIVAAAFTQGTSDFPILLENAMHKTLQAAYGTAQFTWRRFCDVGSVSDFRDHPRYRTAAIGNLDVVNELGEFKNGTIPDGEKAIVRIGTKGKIINISRHTIINDDLGAFIGLSDMLGKAAARTIEADVFALLALNNGLGPTLADGKPLFDAAHNNIGTGAAITTASIEADRVLMATQKEVGGQDFLDLRPAVLLVPIGLGGTAREVNGAEYNSDAQKEQRKPNVVRGLYRDIVDSPRLTGTRRYSFADPAMASVLEVDFLDGNETPFMERKEGFTVDGSSFKVRHDFGVSAVDYRGATTNAGQ